MDWKEHIESNPDIIFGKPVIKGTRVPVDLILEKLAHGATYEQLLKSYPRLTEAAIKACLIFASDTIKTEVTYRLAS